MSEIENWQYPAVILAAVGIIAALFRTIRAWSRREKIIEDHTILLKKCAEKEYVPTETCEIAQDQCQERQDDANATVIGAVNELKASLEKQQTQNHNEMMKMAKSLGRIEGITGRYSFEKNTRG